MGQTPEDIRDNIVRITDENGSCIGTGFFIHKQYCVTCHHNLCGLDRIYIERENNSETGRQKERYHAEWVEEFSDMQKDVAFLKVLDVDLKPLLYRRDTYGSIPVVVRGFPSQDPYPFPLGREERGTLTDIDQPFRWKEEEIIVELEDNRKKWNLKPEVEVSVYAFNGKFHEGFSGAPVCYQHDWKIVGIFEAKDDNQGFIIPMSLVVKKFDVGANGRSISSPSPTLNTQEILDRGNEYFRNVKYEKAIEQYEIVLKDSNHIVAWYNKGNVLYNLGNYEEAIKCYDRALEINPNYVDALSNKAIIFANLDKVDQAIKYIDRVLEINPNDGGTLNAKGVYHTRLDNHEEAIKWYDRALEINPKQPAVFFNKACSEVLKGDTESGIADLKKAIEIDKKKYIEIAKKEMDKDFKSIRNDERFKDLITK
jgi:tetratricopeptide (TPR) repeat protein